MASLDLEPGSEGGLWPTSAPGSVPTAPQSHLLPRASYRLSWSPVNVPVSLPPPPCLNSFPTRRAPPPWMQGDPRPASDLKCRGHLAFAMPLSLCCGPRSSPPSSSRVKNPDGWGMELCTVSPIPVGWGLRAVPTRAAGHPCPGLRSLDDAECGCCPSTRRGRVGEGSQVQRPGSPLLRSETLPVSAPPASGRRGAGRLRQGGVRRGTRRRHRRAAAAAAILPPRAGSSTSVGRLPPRPLPSQCSLATRLPPRPPQPTQLSHHGNQTRRVGNRCASLALSPPLAQRRSPNPFLES